MKSIWKHILSYFILSALAIIPCLVRPVQATERNFPFHPGEKLTFELRWSFVKAGEATMEVLPVETIDNTKVFHFVMTAESNSFIDVFYKVRDRIESYTDVDITHSVLYKKKQKEGDTNRDIVVKFDQEKKEAYYTNFGNPRKPVSILPGTFDPFSAFYYTRLQELKEGKVIKRPVSDGKKCIMGSVSVIKREKIEIAGKTYDTYLIEPELKHVGGVFEKSKDAKIRLWISTDERRIPVRIESKVVVGSFVGELIRVE